MHGYTKEQLKEFFLESIDEARDGSGKGHGGPFGAVVVKGGVIVGRGHNTVLRDNDPSCHAEVNAIRDACKRLGSPHLEGCVLIASSEPCPMCLTTSYWANVDAIFYNLPKRVAAGVGFTDAFIYEDLERPAEERKIPVVAFEGLREEGEAVFREWEAAKGSLY